MSMVVGGSAADIQRAATTVTRTAASDPTIAVLLGFRGSSDTNSLFSETESCAEASGSRGSNCSPSTTSSVPSHETSPRQETSAATFDESLILPLSLSALHGCCGFEEKLKKDLATGGCFFADKSGITPSSEERPLSHSNPHCLVVRPSLISEEKSFASTHRSPIDLHQPPMPKSDPPSLVQNSLNLQHPRQVPITAQSPVSPESLGSKHHQETAATAIPAIATSAADFTSTSAAELHRPHDIRHRRPLSPRLPDPKETTSAGQPLEEEEATSTAIASVAAATAAGDYTYVAPLNSPFYHAVVVPLCDYLVEFLPIWITPNQISFIGLSFAVLSVILSRLGAYSVVGIFWVLYGLFDNLDGKQARRTNTSSPGGEFVDHAIDSIVASLSVLVCLDLLVPGGVSSTMGTLTTLSGQIPFYLGCWAHHSIGRVLLGTQVSGTDWITVDEYNFIMIPALSVFRLLTPALLDHPVDVSSLTNLLSVSQSSVSKPTVVTIGVLIIVIVMLMALISSVVVIRRVYMPRVLKLLLPGLGFGVLGLVNKPPILLAIPCFSLLSFELISHRLHAVKRGKSSARRLWWPVCLYALLGFGCRYFNVAVTWGLSNKLTACCAICLATFTLSLLIRIQSDINSRSKTAGVSVNTISSGRQAQ